MYLTIFNNLIELSLEIGSRGYFFALWIGNTCAISIDTSWIEAAALAFAVAAFIAIKNALTSR